MTVYGKRAPSALSGALVDIIADVLRAPHWRAEVTAYGVDWHDERAGARVALGLFFLVVFRVGYDFF